MSSGATAGHWGVSSGTPVRVRTGRESGWTWRRQRKCAEFRAETARRRSWVSCAAVLSAGDRCSTEQEEWLPRGHRFRTDFSRWSENQALARFVRDREWCPVAITNSLCVNCVRVTAGVNTAENLDRKFWRAPAVTRGTYAASSSRGSNDGADVQHACWSAARTTGISSNN